MSFTLCNLLFCNFPLLCNQILLQSIKLIHFIPFCSSVQISLLWSPLPPNHPFCIWSHLPQFSFLCLKLLSIFSLTHLSPPHCPSRLSQRCPLVFPWPYLFPASVEPLRLHRYSDGGLCRGCGLLLRHSAWRYGTHPLHPLHTITASDLQRGFLTATCWHKRSGSAWYWLVTALFPAQFKWSKTLQSSS